MEDSDRYTSKKLTLIRYCDLYNRAKHIQSRKLFGSYKMTLMSGERLSPKQFKHLSRYLRYDLMMDEKKLNEVFRDYVRSTGTEENEPATLY
jgi:hypothetical protein